MRAKRERRNLASCVSFNEPLDSPYRAGFSAGLYGPNMTNSHFSWFSSQRARDEWCRGKEDGDKISQMTTERIDMAAICKNCQEFRAKHNGEVVRGCFHAYVVCPGERGAERWTA